MHECEAVDVVLHELFSITRALSLFIDTVESTSKDFHSHSPLSDPTS